MDNKKNNKSTNPFWAAVVDKKPPVNTAVLLRGAHFVDSGLFIPQNHFVTLRQTYGPEGELLREPLYGVTHWAFIPPLAGNDESEVFNVCPKLTVGGN